MRFGKPVTELIKTRYSCRTYAERPIAEDIRQKMAEFAASATTGPFGTCSRFELVSATEHDRAALKGLGTYGFIRGATGFVVGANTEATDNLEDYGYLMERIILLATDLGLGTCWLGGSFTRSSFAAKISVQDDEIVPAVTATGYPAGRPRAVDAVIRLGAGSDSRYPWQRLFFDSQFGWPLSREAAGPYAPALEAVRLGPSASNHQPWRIVRAGHGWHLYLQRRPGYRRRKLNRLFPIADMQRLDMGIALCHFELTATELGLKGHWTVDEPDIAKPDDLTEYVMSWIP